MYVRQAWNSDEVWMLDKLEELDIEENGFRSRDYVVAVNDDNDECGFGRIAIRGDSDAVCELRHIRTFGQCDEGHVRTELVRELIKKAHEEDFETVYAVAEDAPTDSFDFEALDETEEAFDLDEDQSVFSLNVHDALGIKTEEEKMAELADEFGYDENTTTKYSID